MINIILQWCRQWYWTSTCSTKYYSGVKSDTEHQNGQTILQWCRKSYWTSTWSTKCYNGVDSNTEHQHDKENTTMVQTVINSINMINKILHWRTVIKNINMINKILHWCRQSYRTSTWSTKYYNGAYSHTEFQHDQQNTTMVHTVIQNVNMINKILQCAHNHIEHQHDQQNTKMV